MGKPNILFILSDQHNSRYLGSAGHVVRTPNMDSLAETGTSFTNCYNNSPLCVPSRSSMLSGLLPEKTEIYNNTQCLRSDRVNLVHSLSAAGYETVLAGRMHFVGNDQRHGYEKRLVGDLTSFFLGLDLGEERYGYLKGTQMPGRTAIEKSGKGRSTVLRYDEDVQKGACDFLENRKDERPLFLTVGFYGPHPPYVGFEKLFDYYYDVLPEPQALTQEDIDHMHGAAKKFLNVRKLGRETADEIRRVRAAYCAMIEYLDSLIGKVIETAEKTIGLDNTVVIYASDHGDSMGDHGMFAKSNFYQNSALVPMICSWPDHIKSNNKISGLTSLLDFAPTLIDIAEGPELPEMDGESLMPYMAGNETISPDRHIISQLADIKGDAPSMMIRKGDYKLVRHVGFSDELYNLKDDPEEWNNLADDAEYEAVHYELQKLLEPHWNEVDIMELWEKNKKHVELLKKWAASQHIRPLETWEGDSKKDNYLL